MRAYLLVVLLSLVSCGLKVDEDQHVYYAKTCEDVAGGMSQREVMMVNPENDKTIRYGIFYFDGSGCDVSNVVLGMRLFGTYDTNLNLTGHVELVPMDSFLVTTYNTNTVCGKTNWAQLKPHRFVGTPKDFDTVDCTASEVFFDELTHYSVYQSEDISFDENVFLLDSNNSVGAGVQTFIRLRDGNETSYQSFMATLFNAQD